MKIALSILILIVLSMIYIEGFVELSGWLDRADFSSLRLQGKPLWAIYLLPVTETLVLVCSVSVLVGVVIATRFTNRAFVLGLLIALPSALLHGWSMLKVIQIWKTLYIPNPAVYFAISVEHFFLLLLAPAVCAPVLARIIFSRRFN